MSKLKSLISYFTKFEIALWCSSVLLIVVSFAIFDGENYLTLIASLLGVTSLIFCAKGNPFGQVLMIMFSTIYGIISLTFQYYGELVTYVGMTLPMAVIALVTWLKNPFKGNKAQVKVNRIGKREIVFMLFLAAIVSVVLYFVLGFCNTARLVPCTFSVTTSFVAAYLSFGGCPFFALVYAFNDIVLIVLWILATMVDTSYFSVIICFAVFLANDMYSFFNWLNMGKKQKREIAADKKV